MLNILPSWDRERVSLPSVHRRWPCKAGLSSVGRSRADQLTPTDSVGRGARGVEVESGKVRGKCVAVLNILKGVQVMSYLESQVSSWKTP